MNLKNLLSLEEIANYLKDKKLYYIAEQTGLSYPTIKKLASGKSYNYSLDTLNAISSHIKKK